MRTEHYLVEKVEVTDTTGAVDTFNGVFAALLSDGESVEKAITCAVKAASLSVQKPAISSIPMRDDYFFIIVF